jgi:hypothetical protein
MIADVKPHQPLKRCDRLFASNSLVVPGRQQPVHVRQHQVGQQRLLVGKVIVQGGCLDAHGSGNLAHGNRRIALCGEQLQRLLAYAICRLGSDAARDSGHWAFP